MTPNNNNNESTTATTRVARSSSEVVVLGGVRGSGDPPTLNARLKDGTSVSDPSAPPSTPPHIAPPELWGCVLDFMAYGDVISALLIGKMFANDVVKYVRVLSFTKGCQLDGPSARRFASVEEVNCLSLISGEHDSTILCRDTTIGLVPLLTTFPKLKEVRIAGLVKRDDGNGQAQLVRARYNPRLCSSPTNHRELAKALCQSLLGAFKTRMLPSTINSRGDFLALFDKSNACRRVQEVEERHRAGRPHTLPTHGVNATGESYCETCKDVCSHFPLEEIIQPAEHTTWCPCADDVIDDIQIVGKRDGARALFRKYSAYYHFIFLHQQLGENGFYLWNTESKEEEELRRYVAGVESKEEEELRLRLADLGVSSKKPGVFYLDTGLLNDIDRLIAVGCDPKAISKEDLYWMMRIGCDDRECDTIAKTTFDALVARGFAFDEADLIVLDERIEPGLDRLRKEIRREELRHVP